jgi:hypothetical protein
MSKNNVWRRNMKPKLKEIGLLVNKLEKLVLKPK